MFGVKSYSRSIGPLASVIRGCIIISYVEHEGLSNTAVFGRAPMFCNVGKPGLAAQDAIVWTRGNTN